MFKYQHNFPLDTLNTICLGNTTAGRHTHSSVRQCSCICYLDQWKFYTMVCHKQMRIGVTWLITMEGEEVVVVGCKVDHGYYELTSR